MLCLKNMKTRCYFCCLTTLTWKTTDHIILSRLRTLQSPLSLVRCLELCLLQGMPPVDVNMIASGSHARSNSTRYWLVSLCRNFNRSSLIHSFQIVLFFQMSQVYFWCYNLCQNLCLNIQRYWYALAINLKNFYYFCLNLYHWNKI